MSNVFRSDKKSSGGANLQNKSVTATVAVQTVLPDSGYDGLSEVTVNPQVHTATHELVTTNHPANNPLDLGANHNVRYIPIQVSASGGGDGLLDFANSEDITPSTDFVTQSDGIFIWGCTSNVAGDITLDNKSLFNSINVTSSALYMSLKYPIPAGTTINRAITAINSKGALFKFIPFKNSGNKVIDIANVHYFSLSSSAAETYTAPKDGILYFCLTTNASGDVTIDGKSIYSYTNTTSSAIMQCYEIPVAKDSVINFGALSGNISKGKLGMFVPYL